MNKTIFLAGATGAVGTALGPMLVKAGYTVYGTTRKPERAAALEAAGVIPVVVDVFDVKALVAELVGVEPWGVIHQLTDLPPALDPAQMQQALIRNARIRIEGTRNLVDAAVAAGVERFVAQSIGWMYEPGVTPYDETRPLDLHAEGAKRTSLNGVIALETAVLETPSFTGTVLRYGRLYGPGTGSDSPDGKISPLHVDASASAALLALQRSPGGIFNISEDDTEITSEKARRDLGWRADSRAMV